MCGLKFFFERHLRGLLEFDVKRQEDILTVHGTPVADERGHAIFCVHFVDALAGLPAQILFERRFDAGLADHVGLAVRIGFLIELLARNRAHVSKHMRQALESRRERVLPLAPGDDVQCRIVADQDSEGDRAVIRDVTLQRHALCRIGAGGDGGSDVTDAKTDNAADVAQKFITCFRVLWKKPWDKLYVERRRVGG